MNTITAKTHARNEVAFQQWVQDHQLEMCERLVAVDDTLTEWRGSFIGGLHGEVERRTVHTTPADPSWCDA